MSFFVYILYSEKYDRFYVGQTKDVDARIIQHNSGYDRSTSPYRPWILECKIQKETRREVLILERKLKNLNHDKMKKFIAKYA